MGADPEQATARVLFVCTGNICRSAAAERLLSARGSDGDGEIPIRSAGTQARPGRPMHPRTQRALARHRVDSAGFTSRRLSAADVDWADLVLTMTGDHRDEVAAVSPRGLHKVFTLMEAAALAESLGSDWSPGSAPHRSVAQALRETRSRFAPARGPAFDVPDPISGSAEVHAAAVDQIADALDRLLPLLARAAPLSTDTARMPRLPPVPRQA